MVEGELREGFQQEAAVKKAAVILGAELKKRSVTGEDLRRISEEDTRISEERISEIRSSISKEPSPEGGYEAGDAQTMLGEKPTSELDADSANKLFTEERDVIEDAFVLKRAQVAQDFIQDFVKRTGEVGVKNYTQLPEDEKEKFFALLEEIETEHDTKIKQLEIDLGLANNPKPEQAEVPEDQKDEQALGMLVGELERFLGENSMKKVLKILKTKKGFIDKAFLILKKCGVNKVDDQAIKGGLFKIINRRIAERNFKENAAVYKETGGQFDRLPDKQRKKILAGVEKIFVKSRRDKEKILDLLGLKGEGLADYTFDN